VFIRTFSASLTRSGLIAVAVGLSEPVSGFAPTACTHL
jgi:hypothetical protein